jgi:hypothetical protein
MSQDSAALRAFFQVAFGSKVGYICIAVSPDLKAWREEYYEWPRQADKMLEVIEFYSAANNVYYCPQLLAKQKRNKENVKACPNIWSDLDTCTPDRLLLQPTVTIESSPGRFQAVWALSEDVSPSDAEMLAMRIAYHHAPHGADRSGWDLSQLLRVPTTFNFKYGSGFDSPQVTVTNIKPVRYKQVDFDIYPPVRGARELILPLPEINIKEPAEDVIQRYRYRMNASVFGLYNTEPEKDWSRALWRLLMFMFEAGMSREEVFHVASTAACNKYARDNKPPEYLWKDVCRAYLRTEENINSIVTQSEQADLVSDQELRDLQSETTFVEDYVAWAGGVGDAAQAYHIGGAFVALSAVLSGTVKIPTSWGNIIPNLWFMILGDTTLTRKSTAMDMAMGILEELDEDLMLATDGSIEGLMTAMTMRPGRPSIFLKDEFSGLLESMSKKDYMAGMAELLTKLYDGKPMKRILRKEIIDIKRPILIIFAGGIKARVQANLDFDHVSSGFMPRFLFLTAKTDVQRVRPLGPPSARDLGERELIKGRLKHIFRHYTQMINVQVTETETTAAKPMEWDAELTDDAWRRYNKVEDDLMKAGLATEHPDLMVPTYSRLAVSCLKAATLIAASRQFTEKVIVEEIDIVRALSYGQQWRDYANEVLNGIGKSQLEKQLERILHAIIANPGIGRSSLMQNFHLTARNADAIFNTLEQRGQVTMIKIGKGQTFHPLLAVGE